MHTVVAVLGTGSIGSRHLRLLLEMEGVTPVAVPVRADRRDELRRQGVPVANSLEECVALGASGAIIATDTVRHAGDAVMAMKMGMDVLVEKPLAVSAKEAFAIRKVAGETGRQCRVACVLRFSESLTRFRELLPEVGPLHHVLIEARSYLPDWRPDRDYRESYSADGNQGGVLRDLIHEIDYAGWIFGWPDSVAGMVRNSGRLGIQAEESARLDWVGPGGFEVCIGLDYLTRPARRRMIASGEKGTLSWDFLTATVRFDSCDGTSTEEVHVQAMDALYAAQLAAFLGLSEKDDKRLAGMDDGVRAVALCDAVRATSGRGMVRLKSFE